MKAIERLVLDNTDQMIFLVEPENLQIVLTNRVAAQSLGYSETELLGKTILDVESALQDVFYWEEVRGGQYSVIESGEGLYLCADGSMRSATKSVRVIENEGQRWLLIQARELHDDHRIEEDLARTTSQLRATLESTGNGILVIDWQGRIASMNRLFSSMWQLGEDLLLRRDDAAIIDFISSRVVDEDLIRRRLREIMESKEIEDTLQLKDGRVFQCKSLPQYLEDRIIGRVFGFFDITERIRIENDLIAARKKAESANQAKAAFLAMMSHEIRTPMNGVMGVTSLMLDTPLNAEQKRYLDIIRSSSESLLSIINDILDFSKIEANKLTLEAIDFSLPDLLEDLADLYALRAAEKGLEFAWSAAPDVPTRIHGDPGRLQQILTNLVGNALKFTTDGGISVRLERRPDKDGRIVLSIAVQDTGIGISAENLSRIFAPFEQADSTTTRKYGGTGLGLAICKQLVGMMDGTIGVSSKENEGATFSLEIVLDRPVDSVSEAGEIVCPEAFQGIRTLVIDDNPTALAGLMSFLENCGGTTDGVPDVDAGVRRIHVAQKDGRPYRCVFVDAEMALGDDGKPDRRLLDAQRSVGCTLVLCLPAGSKEEGPRFERDGVRFSVRKPIRRAMLRDCLLTVLGQSTVEPVHDVAAPERSDNWKQTVRLLIVEDNVINTMVLQGVLGKLGFSRIDKARDGIEAIESVENKQYDLILMDCQMPRMDGYDSTRRLREMGVETPIVAMTAHALSGDREKCLVAGMNDYLTKPVVIDALAACLEKWLRPEDALPDESVERGANENLGSGRDFLHADFMKLMMGDAELAATLLKMFAESTPEGIERLRSAIASGERAEIKAAAHYIKGAAANMCAAELRDVAYDIEMAAQDGNIALADRLVRQLDTRWQDFLRHPKVREGLMAG
jgi:PAS domain S-box-containing protein